MDFLSTNIPQRSSQSTVRSIVSNSSSSTAPFLIGLKRDVIHPVGYLVLGNDDRAVGPIIDTRQVGFHLGGHVLHYGSGGIEGVRRELCVDGIWRIMHAREGYARFCDTGVAVGALPGANLVLSSEPGGLISHTDLPWEIYSAGLLEVGARNQVALKPDTPHYLRPYIAETACQLGVDSTEGWVFAVISRDMDPYLGNAIHTGVTLWAPGPTKFCRADPRCGLPDKKGAINYVLGKKLKHEGKKRYGVNDVLQFGLDGRVKECTGQNFFIRIGNTWYTPMLDGCLLPGINRRRAIAILKALGHDVVECLMDGDMLWRADEVFLTGTWTGIVPVRVILYGPLQPIAIMAPFHDKDPGMITLEVMRIHTALAKHDLDNVPDALEIGDWWLESPS